MAISGPKVPKQGDTGMSCKAGDASLHQSYWDAGYKRGYAQGIEDAVREIELAPDGSDVLHLIRSLKNSVK